MVLLQVWREKQGMPPDVDAAAAQKLLQPVAMWMQQRGRKEATFAELAPLLTAPLRELKRPRVEAKKLLNSIRDQSGLLVWLGEERYSFLHLSLQEYLVARHIQDRALLHPEDVEQLAGHFGDDAWREVILLAVGLTNPSLFEPLMHALLRTGAVARNASLTYDCLRDAPEASAGPFLQALAAGLEDADTRYTALRLLQQLPGWEEATVTTRRSRLLGWLRRSEPLTGRALVERMAGHDRSPQVRSMATELLGGRTPLVATGSTAGQERAWARDGTVLVFVPAGVYSIGDDDLDFPNEEVRGWARPAHAVTLSGYWIGKYAVSNAQYRRFLAANPAYPKPMFWDDKQFDQPEQPVVGVSYGDALAYCEWAGLQLPSEARWEAAARGPAGRRFPWGDEPPDDGRANFGGELGRTSPVGAYPKGGGPFGTLDQSGNVWEWCADEWRPDAYAGRADAAHDPVVAEPSTRSGEVRHAPVRGGAWDDPAVSLAASVRLRGRAGVRVRALGFRVCAPAQPGQP